MSNSSNQGLNFNEIKKKLEQIQIKDHNSRQLHLKKEDKSLQFSQNPQLTTNPYEKKQQSHKQTRDSHSKRKFEALKIEDFHLYSTLGSFFLFFFNFTKVFL